MKWIKRILKQALVLPGLRIIPEYIITRKYIRENQRSKSGERFLTPWICEINDPNPERWIRYKDEVFTDYFRLSGLSIQELQGKRILEIGPGSNLGVAFELLLAGASQVVCVDRFHSLGDLALQIAVYRSMREKLSESRKKDFDSILYLVDDRYTLNPDRIQYYGGTPVETLRTTFPEGAFDIILSRAVLEHVYDLDSALDSMDRLLAPGGYLLHEVDFRDHGIFTFFGLNPLTFLTVSDSVWEKLGSHIGAPNRHLVDFFEAKLSSLGYATKTKVKHIFGSEKVVGRPQIQEGKDYGSTELSMIRSIQRRLQPRFRSLPPEKLLISVIFFAACKSTSRALNKPF